MKYPIEQFHRIVQWLKNSRIKKPHPWKGIQRGFLVISVLLIICYNKNMQQKIPVEVSARHIHLSQKDLEALFGKGYELKIMKQLTQPSDFAAKETVDIQNDSKVIKKLRIVGPVRRKTQIELSTTDAYFLGINLPLRISGNLKNTPGITLIGPKGKIKIKEGVIDDRRHIHCTPQEAKKFGLTQKRMVSVKVEGKEAITFHNVKVRIGKNYKLCMHLDTDEGNACGIHQKSVGFLMK